MGDLRIYEAKNEHEYGNIHKAHILLVQSYPFKYCPFCAEYIETAYCKVFDACYFIDTGDWTEKTCSCLKCEFCSSRPLSHSPVCECKKNQNLYSK